MRKPIREAPTRPIFNSDEQERAWVAIERRVEYIGKDKDGNEFVMQNPAAWEERKNEDGTTTRIRPIPRRRIGG